MPEITKKYIDTGQVRYVYREFPLTSIHNNAQKASEAAVCAGRQDRYWDMNEKIFEEQDTWSAEADATGLFKQYAQELGLNTGQFNQCLDNGEAALEVQADVMAGQQLGVNGTPSIFINDVQVQAGLSTASMGQIIEFLAAGGEVPDILPTGEDPHLLGNRQTAKAVTVAFIDFASAESRQHALEVLPQLKETYIDTGKLLYMAHLWSPGSDTPSSFGAAAAECAGQQGKFWEMHDQLFEKQAEWTQEEDPTSLFSGYASDLALDTTAFEECLSSDWATVRSQAGSVVAALYGVPGAPAFLFNNRSGQEGSPTFDEFKATIDSILNQ